MWWMRRRGTPVWVWVLAFLGMKSLWSWRAKQDDPVWQEKRRRFRTKLDEAFDVWREDPPGQADEARTD